MKPTFAILDVSTFETVMGHVMPTNVVRGFSMHLEGAPQLVVGVIDEGWRHRLFAHFEPGFRMRLRSSHAARRALVLASRRAVDMVAGIAGPVDTVADPEQPQAAAFLKRMNFLPIDANLHRFSGLTLREKVIVAERWMLAHGAPVEIPVEHVFSDGVYAREIRIPAGTLLTGKIHKRTNLNYLLEGEISVLTDTGVQRLRAPARVLSSAGTKRIAYTHTGCRWVTIHGTTKTDVDEIESEFIAQTEGQFLAYLRQIEHKDEDEVEDEVRAIAYG